MRHALYLMFLGIMLTLPPAHADDLAGDPKTIDPEYPPGVLELSFTSGGSKLNAHIYLADGPGPHPTAVFLHGFPGFEKNLDIAQAVRREGWNAFFFHYRGAWGSEGIFSFSNGLADVAAALAYLRDPANAELRVNPAEIALVGHSMGGFMALRGGANDDRVRCIVGIASANLGERSEAARADSEELAGFKEYSDTLGMLAGFDGASAIRDLAENGDAMELTAITPMLAGRKVLLIAGERDQAVDIGVHERLMAAYSTQPEISLTGIRMDADHSFSWLRLTLAREITTWLNRTCLGS